MLVGRKQSAVKVKPRNAPVSSPHLLGRRATIRPLRADTALKRTEERRAAKTIEQTMQSTENVRAVLKDAHEELRRIQEKKLEESSFLSAIEQRLKRAREDLGSTIFQKDQAEQHMEILKKARDNVNADISIGSARLVDLETTITSRADRMDSVEKRITELVEICDNVEGRRKRGEQEQAKLETEIRDLGAEKEVAGREVEKARGEYSMTLANIEEAITSFRIFEARIARFSKDTGYIVGYPKQLKKKK